MGGRACSVLKKVEVYIHDLFSHNSLSLAKNPHLLYQNHTENAILSMDINLYFDPHSDVAVCIDLNWRELF